MKHLYTAVVAAALAFGAHAQTPQPTPVPTPVPQPGAPAPAAGPVQIPAAPASSGAAWLVMDYESGQILAGDNIDTPLDPASITKVMTTYVVAAELAAGKVALDDQVLISERAWREGGAGTDGSYSGFDVNTRAPLEEVLKGMVVQSGNDASIALAEHIAGTEEAFAQLMNSYAQRLGMTNSHFVNSHGLTAPGHQMSARDIAILGRALIRDFPEHYALHAIKEYTHNNIRQYNRNGLLWKDSTVDGIKTGHTSAAGYCLLASAKRGDQRLLSVVMGIQGSRTEGFRRREGDSLALLNWGFRFYETQKLYDAQVKIADQRVWKGTANSVDLGLAEPLLVSLPRGRYEELQATMDVPTRLVAPIAQGQQVGTVRVRLDGEVVAERPLIALSDVSEAGFFGRLYDDFWMWWESE
ncbi:D-alanyl-D-alanine carboxypeptidase family protein [Coralloluteibacterium thermophilus]|uniref:serine-type D-Ala-D-Ala carboxypeptidase n=1 Tax=Coralloluteibacterium thermophilum TaxID=2707049 RepID=A0ABV9NNF4_9GAMM